MRVNRPREEVKLYTILFLKEKREGRGGALAQMGGRWSGSRKGGNGNFSLLSSSEKSPPMRPLPPFPTPTSTCTLRGFHQGLWEKYELLIHIKTHTPQFH